MPDKSYGYGFYENAADVEEKDGRPYIVPERCVGCGYVLPAVKPDADNLAKAALDACNGIIWRDDALICSLLVKKRYAAYPCLEIKVVPEGIFNL